MKKVTFNVKDQAKFLAFLKRFALIESSLLVEIDGDDLKAKTHTPERSVVKSSKELLTDIIGDAPTELPTLKFGIFNINKFMGAFKHFVDQFDMTINYDQLDGENVGTSIVLHNKKLKVSFDCASHRIFTHISEELMDRIADVSDYKNIDVNITEAEFGKIASLFAIDADDKFFTISVGGGISIKSKSFELAISDTQYPNSFSINCYKQHFNLADKEDSDVIISEEKLIFKSNISNTLCVVSRTDD